MHIIQVWRWPVRLMHWSMVAAFGVAMWTRNSLWDQLIHAQAGYVMAFVLFLRIIYGFAARDLASFRRFPPQPGKGVRYLIDLVRGNAKNYLGHNPAGALAIYGMLLLGVATVFTGYLAFEYDYEFAKDWHHDFAYVWFGMVCLHVSGVLIASLAHKEFLVIAMVTGNKTRRCVREPFLLSAALVTLLMIVLESMDFLVRMLGGKGFVLKK
jgi:cytochrome b